MGDKLTTDDVQKILNILDASQFDELRLETGDFKLTLRRSSAIEPAAPPATAKSPPALAPSPTTIPAIAAPTSRPALAQDITPVKAPMLGVFYRAPKPGAPPFVEVGAKVEPRSVIGIVEVMKLMNSIHADVAGEVVEILAADGQMVEFDQTLLHVRRC